MISEVRPPCNHIGAMTSTGTYIIINSDVFLDDGDDEFPDSGVSRPWMVLSVANTPTPSILCNAGSLRIRSIGSPASIRAFTWDDPAFPTSPDPEVTLMATFIGLKHHASPSTRDLRSSIAH